jgi:hypothetical protein
MKKLFLFLTIPLLALAPAVAQTPQGGETAAARPARQRLIGEVTAVDAAAKQLTVRADSGETATVTTTEQTTYLRMPPGETSLQKGQPAAFADVRVGDRVLAPGLPASGGAARQVILMARAAASASGGGAGRDDGRRLNGRVVSADASKKLIVVQTRGREGAEAVTVDASSAARVLRFAPDSTRPADAQPGSLADVRPGDSLRATGERSADGRGFKAEEVLTGAFMRFAGKVTSVDAARGELTVAGEQGDQTVTLTLGSRSTLRRSTPEFEQLVAQRAERFGRREQRRAAGQGGGGAQGEGGAPREGRREGERGRRREGGEGEQRAGDGERRGEGGARRGGQGGGGNIQQMIEGLPAVTLADLKKGDAVVVTLTPGANASRATIVSLLTGPAEMLRGMQMFQRGSPEGQRGMSPGLPGDVMGGGQGPTREPPR